MGKEKQNNEAVSVFKALADESRLKIVSILLKQDSYAQYLAEKLNLTAPTVTYHMEKLEKCGLVFSTKIQHYIIYSINREIMDTQIGALIESAIAYDDTITDEERVIESF